MQLHLKKYQIWLLTALSGLLMGVAWPVNGFAPLIFIAWVPLLLVENYIKCNPDLFSRGAVVLYSYFGFLIFNLFTTWWVSHSTLGGAILAFLINSLLMSLTFGLSHLLGKKVFANKVGSFALVSSWVSFEYLHMDWDLTWSWLNMGNVFSENPNWVQWYEYTGVLGGSIWVLLVNIVVYKALMRWINFGRKIQYSITYLGLALVLILGPIMYSYQLKKQVNDDAEHHIKVLCVQPNVDPYAEAYATPSEELVNNMLNIVRAHIELETELIISPESTIERGMWEEKIDWYPAIDSVRKFIGKYPNLSVLMGASTRKELEPDEPIKAYAHPFYDDSSRYYCKYNTALLVAKDKPVMFYHKAKLVPGVERMPFAAVLKPIEKYAINLGGTSGSLGVSDEPILFPVNKNAYVAPIICYESIYGETVGGFFDANPGFIAIITNDAWWFDSPGYRQHFSYARLRAIENRKYIARSANTGISGVIDHKGEVLQRTDFYTKTAVKAEIPLFTKLTYYAANGDYLGRLAVFVMALLILVGVSRDLSRGRIKHNKG